MVPSRNRNCWITIGLSLLLLSAALAEEPRHEDPFAWTTDYSLIVTNARSYEQASDIVDFISAHGGQVGVVVSPRLMLGWAPKNLVGQNLIRSIQYKPMAAAALPGMNVDEADSLAFFNEVASGQWRVKKAGLTDHHRVVTYPSDAFEPPRAILLREKLGDFSQKPLAASQSPGNSDQMTGKVRFNGIFVESDGAIDPNTYTWACADVSTIVSEISASLTFWSSKALTYGVPLTYFINYFRPPQCPGGTKFVLTSYEPILHAQSQDSLWIEDIMCNFGFCTGNKFTDTSNFNAFRRTVSPVTNWSATSFIGYNPSPAPTTFTDGFFAYAYRGGPYSQLLFRNDGWAITQYHLVNSHETGHLFGQYDEYAASGCSNCTSGDSAGNNTVDGNCQNCNSGSVPCMMRFNESALCGYSIGTIGWGLNITAAKTIGTSSFVEKTNFVPGQAIRYIGYVNVPSLAPGTCLDVNFNVFRQFQSGLTEANGPFTLNCFITSAGTWFFYEFGISVPGAAQDGEATVEMQFDIKVNGSSCPIGECRYAKGIRSSARGHFFVLGAGANPIPTAPPNPEFGGGKLD